MIECPGCSALVVEATVFPTADTVLVEPTPDPDGELHGVLDPAGFLVTSDTIPAGLLETGSRFGRWSRHDCQHTPRPARTP